MIERRPYHCIGVAKATAISNFRPGNHHAENKTDPDLLHYYASQDCAQVFSDFGFPDVYSLDGGFRGLAHGGLSTQKLTS